MYVSVSKNTHVAMHILNVHYNMSVHVLCVTKTKFLSCCLALFGYFTENFISHKFMACMFIVIIKIIIVHVIGNVKTHIYILIM